VVVVENIKQKKLEWVKVILFFNIRVVRVKMMEDSGIGNGSGNIDERKKAMNGNTLD
jgi:hypothetical protein